MVKKCKFPSSLEKRLEFALKMATCIVNVKIIKVICYANSFSYGIFIRIVACLSKVCHQIKIRHAL